MDAITVELPQLYPKQARAIFDPARFVIIEASTKSGKSAGCLIWQLAQVLEDDASGQHLWVAPSYSQAGEMFGRAKGLLRDAGLPFTANESTLTLRLENGASWVFRTGEKPDNLYGFDIRSLVVDEASRVKEAAWVAVYSTLTATGASARIIGNTKGRGTWFYRLGQRAKQGLPDHAHHRLTAYDAVEGGVLSLEIVEQARRDLPEHTFRELYLAEASEDGLNPFGYRHLEACRRGALSGGAVVAWGWDFAKETDWTVGVGLDAEAQVAAIIRFQKRPWPDVTRAVLTNLSAPATVDATGAGAPVYDALIEASPAHHVEGFVFTGRSKPELVEELIYAVQQHKLGFPGEGPLWDELDALEVSHTRTGTRYEAPSGCHDDCVMALALAWRTYRRIERSLDLSDFAEWNAPPKQRATYRVRPNARQW